MSSIKGGMLLRKEQNLYINSFVNLYEVNQMTTNNWLIITNVQLKTLLCVLMHHF